MIKSPLFESLGKIATLILTIYGIASLPFDIIDKTHSNISGIIIAFVLTVALGATAIYYFIPPLTLKRFGLKRRRTNPILAYDKEIAEIDSNFRATVFTDKTLIYPEKPFPEDLVDILEVSQSEKIDETVYWSEDSQPSEFVRKRDNTLAVYWRPLTEILPFVPYNHITQFKSPSLYGDDAFWQAFHVDLDTGVIDWTFKCSHKVELAIAFQLPYLNTRITYEKLDRLAFIKKRRDCAQPTIDPEGKNIYWKLVSPKKNRSYVCFVFYEGGIEKFRNSVRRSGWLKRLFLKSQ